jgi:hypothetical protein
MILTDNTQVVTAKRVRLLDFAVWPIGKHHMAKVVKSKDQYDALWDAFHVSGTQLVNRYKKSHLPYDPQKTFLLDLGGQEYVIRRLSNLQLDTTYKVYA